jgi:hypothetical protein
VGVIKMQKGTLEASNVINVDWDNLTQVRAQWRALLNTEINFLVPKM